MCVFNSKIIKAMNGTNFFPTEIPADSISETWRSSTGFSQKGSILSQAGTDVHGHSGQPLAKQPIYFSNAQTLASPTPKEALAQKSPYNSLIPSAAKPQCRSGSMKSVNSPSKRARVHFQDGSVPPNLAHQTIQPSSFNPSLDKNSVMSRDSTAQQFFTGVPAHLQRASAPTVNPANQVQFPHNAVPIRDIPQFPGASSQKSLVAHLSPSKQFFASSTGFQSATAGYTNPKLVNYKVPHNVYQQMNTVNVPQQVSRTSIGVSPAPTVIRTSSKVNIDAVSINASCGAANFYAQSYSMTAQQQTAHIPTSPGRCLQPNPSATCRNTKVVERSTSMHFRESKVFRPTLTSVKSPVSTPIMAEKAIITEKFIDKPIDVIIERPVPVFREVKVPVNVLVENHIDKVIKRDVITEVVVEKPVDKFVEVIVDKVVEVPYEKVIDVPVYTQKVVEVPRQLVVDKLVDKVIENHIYTDKVIEIDEEEFARLPPGGVSSPHGRMFEREISRHLAGSSPTLPGPCSPSPSVGFLPPSACSPPPAPYFMAQGNPHAAHRSPQPNGLNFVGSSKLIHSLKSSQLANCGSNALPVSRLAPGNACSLSNAELDSSRPRHIPVQESSHVSVVQRAQRFDQQPRFGSHSSLAKTAQNTLFAHHLPDTFRTQAAPFVNVYQSQSSATTSGATAFVNSTLPRNNNIVLHQPQPFSSTEQHGWHTAEKSGEYGDSVRKMRFEEVRRPAAEQAFSSYYDRSFTSGIATVPEGGTTNQLPFSVDSVQQVALNPFLHFKQGDNCVPPALGPPQVSGCAETAFQAGTAQRGEALRYDHLTTYSPVNTVIPFQNGETLQTSKSYSNYKNGFSASHNVYAQGISVQKEPTNSALRISNAEFVSKFSHNKITAEIAQTAHSHVRQLSNHFDQEQTAHHDMHITQFNAHDIPHRTECAPVQRHVELEEIIEKPVYREKLIEKPIFIEKIIEKEVIVPVERIIPIEVEKVIEVPIDIIIDNPIIQNRIVEKEKIIERRVSNRAYSPKLSLNASLMNESIKLDSKIQQIKSELTVLRSSIQNKRQMVGSFQPHMVAKENQL